MSTATKSKLGIKVYLENDEDTESPFEHDIFKLMSVFNTGSDVVLQKLQELNEQNLDNKGITWWLVSRYMHGGECWFLQDQTSACADPWDTTRFAGLLYLESNDPMDIGCTEQEDATQVAAAMLKTYNAWTSCDTWWYKIEVEQEQTMNGVCPCCKSANAEWTMKEYSELDSCGGFIGIEYPIEEIVDSLQRFKGRDEVDVSAYEVSIVCDEHDESYADTIKSKLKEVGFNLKEE